MQRDLALALGGMTVFAAVAAFGACSTEAAIESPGPSDASAETTVDASAAEDVFADVYEDLSFDFATDVAWDTGPLETPDSPAPVLACDVDGGDGGECPLPPSHCLDGRWLESYVNGSCVDGTCKWWRVYHDCQAEGASSCSDDRCRSAIVK